MPIIVKSPKAKPDLVEIWSYIADDSEIRADAFIQTIDKKFHSLINEPFLGIARDEIETDLRSFPVGRYVIFSAALLKASKLSESSMALEI